MSAITASLRGRTSTGASAGRTRGTIVTAGADAAGAGGGLLAKIGAGCGPDCRNSALIAMVSTVAAANKAAAVSVKHGKGKVVLIGFRPQHRDQTHGTFKLVFNAFFNTPAATTPTTTTAQ